MHFFRTFFLLLMNNWAIVAIFLLSIAVVSTGLMQSNQKKEIERLEQKIDRLEKGT